MGWACRVILVALCTELVAGSGVAAAQQATVSTPYHAVGDSFFENFGISWGINAPGFTFRFGGPNAAGPPFGRFEPNAGANLGFGFNRRGTSGYFNANFAQGSRQSLVTQVPMVTLSNGVPGYVADYTVRPFVIGYVPVVGGYPTIPAVMPLPAGATVLGAPTSSGVGADAVRDALRQHRARSVGGATQPAAAPAAGGDPKPAQQAAQPRARDQAAADQAKPGDPGNAQDRIVGHAPDEAAPAAPATDPAHKLALAQTSSAGRAVPSVAEARRLRAAEQQSKQNEAEVYYERGLSAEAAGNPGAAKAYYQMAARRASGDFKQKIAQRLDALKTPAR